MDKFKQLLLSEIDPPHESIRLSIDPVYVTELAGSMVEQGLLQPIVVRPVNGRHEIIAGHRRYLAATKLGWVKIPCSIKTCTDQEAATLKATENITRVDLTPIEEACAYKDLLDSHTMTIEQIAKKTGKSGGIIKRRLDLLKMPPCLQEAIHKKLISYSVAEELWGLGALTQIEYYLSYAIDNGATKEVVRGWVTDYKRTLVTNVDAGEEGRQPLSPAQNKPHYLTCDVCSNPVELGKQTVVQCCPECVTILRTAGDQT